MAEYCAEVIIKTPFSKDRFSAFSGGGGGAALACEQNAAAFWKKNIRMMGFAMAGYTESYVRKALEENFTCWVNQMPSADAALGEVS